MTGIQGRPLRVAINGFGRIGRRLARLILDGYASPVFQGASVELVAINDLLSSQQIVHALRLDSVHGRWRGDLSLQENRLTLGPQNIALLKEKDPSILPWGELQVDVVLECSGLFTRRQDAQKHLQAGARRVVISAPSPDPDWTVCVGVNHQDYRPDQHRIISNASCTTNCLSPVVQILDQNLGLRYGDMLTVHSYTNDQVLLDTGHSDPRRARGAALSMIPTTTGAAQALSLVLPHLEGRISGLSVRVPTPNVSLVYFTGELNTETSPRQVNALFKKASDGPYQTIVDYTEEPEVSCDYNGTTVSATVDGLLTEVTHQTRVRVVAWYDNETGFSARLLDLVQLLA